MVSPVEEKSGVTSSVDAADCKDALDRIVRSREFQRSKRAVSFLQYVVNETLEGRSYRIKQRTIAVEVFDRPDDFDQHNDPVVRVTAAHVRRRLKSYYVGEGNQDPFIIEIPKGTYVPKFRTEAQPEPVVPFAGENQRPVVAVFPFETRNDDEITGLLANGIPMEVSSELSRYTQLAVVSFSTTRHCRPESSDPRGVAASLGADFVVTGQVYVANGRCRVSVQVNEASRAIQQWTRRYDFPLEPDSIQEMEDTVVKTLLSQIGGRFGAIPQSMARASKLDMPHEMDAYRGFLQYYRYIERLTPENCRLAQKALERAIELEPENASLLGFLATVYLDDVVFSFLGGRADSLDLGRELARRANAADPQCPDALETLAFAKLLDGDASAVVRAADEILDLSPGNAYLVGSAGFFLACAGQVKRGADMVRRSISLNPRYPTWFNIVFFLDDFLAGRFDKALVEAEKLRQPRVFVDPLIRAATLGKLGRPEASIALRELERIAPDFWDDPHLQMKSLILDRKVREVLLDGLEPVLELASG